MQELFKKYLENECSPGEAKKLMGYFEDPENEVYLRSFINETLENGDTEENGDQWATMQDETFAEIKKQLNTEKGKLVPFFRKTWFRVAAAAVLLAGGFGIYNLISKTNREADFVHTNVSMQPPAPGNNKAILTLADGSTVNLETARVGPLSKQGNTRLLKAADGQVLYKSLNEKSTEVLLNSIATPRAGQYQVILSDGSAVWLNAASSLRFPATFSGKERKVVLTGEAYFEVAKHTSMPFKVEIPGKAEVVVLGTHFNVNAYNDEAVVNTTLLEGSVHIKGLATGKSQIIIPGEQAELGGNGEIIINKKANTEQAIAWKNGVFNFNKADLGMVLRQLSRWYDLDIIVEGQLPVRQFNGEIQRNLKLSQILRVLEQNEVHCKIEGKKLIIIL